MRQGQTYAVIGNGVVGVHVLEAIAAEFEKSSGELADRLYAALKAGSLAGGDRQPDTATAIFVIRKQYNNDDVYVSVRVDSHADPFHELRRVLDLQLARNYAAFRNYLVENGKTAEALSAAEKAVQYEPVGRRRITCTWDSCRTSPAARPRAAGVYRRAATVSSTSSRRGRRRSRIRNSPPTGRSATTRRSWIG